jgi:hypothetical protein
MLDDFEANKKLTEVWVVSRDLKPDSSNEEVGKLVSRNLRKGIKYIYFCSEDLPHFQAEVQRLLKNINAVGKIINRVQIVILNRRTYDVLSSNGNIVLYFHDKKRSLLPKCFEEIVFTQIQERGTFWQEHSEDQADKIRYLLEPELTKS